MRINEEWYNTQIQHQPLHYPTTTRRHRAEISVVALGGCIGQDNQFTYLLQMSIDCVAVLHTVLRFVYSVSRKPWMTARRRRTSAGVSSGRNLCPPYVNLNVPEDLELEMFLRV